MVTHNNTTTEKRIEECYCEECDSKFKLIFNPDETSRYYSYCPFCGEELEFDDDDDFDRRNEEKEIEPEDTTDYESIDYDSDDTD